MESGAPSMAPSNPEPSQRVIEEQPKPQTPGLLPESLNTLNDMDEIVIQQKVKLLNADNGVDMMREYSLLTVQGQLVLQATEKSENLKSKVRSTGRGSDLDIKDTLDQKVIHLFRPFSCQTCCTPCCLPKMEITSPPGTLIGTVEQEWTLCRPSFLVKDETESNLLRITGPCSPAASLPSSEFEIFSPDGVLVGKMTKFWRGVSMDEITNVDNFELSFPKSSDIKTRITLIGAVFLIDFLYFESITTFRNR